MKTGGCRSPAVQPADVGFVTDSHAQVWLYSPYLCVCVMVGTGGCRSPVVQPAGAGLCHQQSWTVWLYSPMCVWWQVQEGVDHLLYNLLVLGCVTVIDSVTVLTCVCVMTGTGGCRSPVVQPAGAGLCHRQSWTGVAALTYGSLPGGNCATAGPEGSTGNS